MRPRAWLFLLPLVFALPVLAAQDGSGAIGARIQVRERANGDHSLLIAVESPDKITSIRINLPGGFQLVPGWVPSSWKHSLDGRRLTASGEPLFRVNLRFDVKRDDDLIRKLDGKELDVEAMTANGSRPVRLKLKVETTAPVRLLTSLDGALTAPPEFTPNQPFFVTFEPDFRGGVWVPMADVTGSSADREEARRNAVREAAKRTEAISRETSKFFRTLALKRDDTAPSPPAVTRLRAFEDVPTMSYFDEFVEEMVEAGIVSKPVPANSCTPAVTGGTPMVFAGKDACVSGCFPTESSDLEQFAKLLMLDDRPLVPKAASPTTIVVRVEADTKPGPRTIRWNNIPGAAPGQLPIIVLGLEGTIDRDKLMRGESTTMRLRILGGDQRIALRIVNKTPSIIQVEGGESQVVTTSGGFDNVVTREVRGIKKGNFAIDYSLDQPPCGGGR